MKLKVLTFHIIDFVFYFNHSLAFKDGRYRSMLKGLKISLLKFKL